MTAETCASTLIPPSIFCILTFRSVISLILPGTVSEDAFAMTVASAELIHARHIRVQ